MTDLMDEAQVYQALVEQAQVGDACKEFLTTPTGKYLLDRAKKAEMSVLHKLAVADIHNIELLTRLQIEAAVPRRFLQFLSEAIITGEQSQFQLVQTD